MSITEQALRASVAGGYRTLPDVGREFGVTGERIRQLCVKYDIERSRRDWNSYCSSYQAQLSPRSRWPREGISALKRRIGLCQQRGCFSKQAPARVRCPHHLQAILTHVRRYYDNKRERGLCLRCSAPAAPDHTQCQPHLDELRVSNRRRYYAHKAAA